MTTDALSGYRDNPYLNKQFREDADHDMEHTRLAYQAWSLGMNVAHEISIKGTALRMILQRAAEESAVAVMELVECDMNSTTGVERARALQSRAIRYRELVEWLHEAIAIGNDAATDVEDALKEIQDGTPPNGVDGTTDGLSLGEMYGFRPVQSEGEG